MLRRLKRESWLLVIGLVASIGVIVVFSIRTSAQMDSLREQFLRLGEDEYRLEYLLARFEKLAMNMERGERGYLLTGDPAFLDPYFSTKWEIEDAYYKIVFYLTGDPGLQDKTHAAWGLVQRWIKEVGEPEIAMRGQVNKGSLSPTALVLSVEKQKSEPIMEDFRHIVEEIAAGLDARRAATMESLNQVRASILSRTWITLAIMVVVVGFVESIALLRLFALQRARNALSANESRLKVVVEKLRLATRMKSNFLANMSHEIRTPLNSILGFAQLLQREYHGPLNEKQRTQLNYITKSGDHLLRLINDVLDLSKVEAGKMSLEIASFHLPLVLDGCLGMFREQASRRGMALSLDVEEGIEVVEADQRKIQQVILNLLSNAMKFTPDGGKVRLRARWSIASAPADGVPHGRSDTLIEVEDTGIGIANEIHGLLFEPFSQLDTGYARKYEGTGLGLALVKRFVELHGGRVWVASEGPGKGSTFSFTIPSVAREERPKEAPAAAPASRAPSLPPLPEACGFSLEAESKAHAHHPGQPTLLLVEDNPDMLSLLADATGGRYNILTARNGRHALEQLSLMPRCDLVVSDIMMAEMDGYQLLERMQQVESWKEIPFVILTARATPEERLSGLRRGAVDFVFKPFAVEELLARIDSQLRSQEIKRRAAQKEHLAALGILLAGIAHEMKNPLSSITGPIENLRKLLCAAPPGDERVEKNLDYISLGVQRLDGLIRRLSTILSRRDVAQERLDMQDIIQSAMKPFQFSESGRIRFESSVDPSIVVRGDKEMVSLILSNLVANAVEAIEDQGEVCVWVEREDGETRVRVLDTGRGISKEQLSRIFDPFYTTKNTGEVMGLGLFLVKTLCQQLGWTVEVETRHESGTEFVLRLP